jgi:hypothetical protein
MADSGKRASMANGAHIVAQTGPSPSARRPAGKHFHKPLNLNNIAGRSAPHCTQLADFYLSF